MPGLLLNFVSLFSGDRQPPTGAIVAVSVLPTKEKKHRLGAEALVFSRLGGAPSGAAVDQRSRQL
jgi:hypothetical protein